LNHIISSNLKKLQDLNADHVEAEYKE